LSPPFRGHLSPLLRGVAPVPFGRRFRGFVVVALLQVRHPLM
jgi:hypothetical protein